MLPSSLLGDSLLFGVHVEHWSVFNRPQEQTIK